LILTVIYSGLVYITANNCFKAVDFFPDHALRWMGGHAHSENMGDPGQIGAIATGAAGMLASHAASAVGSIGKRGATPGRRPSGQPAGLKVEEPSGGALDRVKLNAAENAQNPIIHPKDAPDMQSPENSGAAVNKQSSKDKPV
jgi:hypothetical protein